MSFGTQEITTGYIPRPYQNDMHRAMATKRFGVLVFHRRAGKTVGVINELIDKGLSCPLENPQYAYIAPTYGQAKRIAWEYFKKFTKMIPTVEYYEGELKVVIHRPHLKDKVTYYLLGAENPDSLAGLYLDGAVLDEYSLQNPNIWTLIIRPALSDRKGWGLFIGTCRGHNHFYDLYNFALAHAENWYARLLSVVDTKIIPEDELAMLREEMPEEQYNQEYLCSWQAALTGAYYGAYLNDIEKKGQITSVPVEQGSPVYTAWDLGIGDSTAIWFWQYIGKEIHIIDYLESSGRGLEYYVAQIAKKEYFIEQHFFPHDVEARELGSGQTRKEMLRELGLRRMTTLPKQKIEDRINAVRKNLSKMWFDKERCADGLRALRNYQKKYDNKTKTWSDTPLHDWASNGADSFGYLCLALRPPRSSMIGSMQNVVDAMYNVLG